MTSCLVVAADVEELKEKLDVIPWERLQDEFSQYLDMTPEQMKQYIESLPPEAFSKRKPVSWCLPCIGGVPCCVGPASAYTLLLYGWNRVVSRKQQVPPPLRASRQRRCRRHGSVSHRARTAHSTSTSRPSNSRQCMNRRQHTLTLTSPTTARRRTWTRAGN